MRFMILVKATPSTEAQTRPVQTDTPAYAAMRAYHEELAQAGVLLDAAGLRPSRHGWRITYAGGSRQVVDGPFPTGDLLCGYTLIEVRDREEAIEWARRFPAPHGALADSEIEVRPLFDADDFAPRASDAAFSSSPARQPA